MNMLTPRFAWQVKMYLVTALLASLTMFNSIPASADDTATPEPPAATVNGRAISNAELDAYLGAHQLPHQDALREMIDLMLLKTAATELRIKLPAEPWSSEAQAAVELSVAQGLAIEVAKPRSDLILDHAWLKDAEGAKERIAGRENLEKLRELVVAGSTIPAAFARMQLDGALWHIGDHEEYPYEAIPTEARDLPPGVISPIIPGDGGLHLFRIYERKQSLLPMEVISSQLRDELRRRATIEQPEW